MNTQARVLLSFFVLGGMTVLPGCGGGQEPAAPPGQQLAAQPAGANRSREPRAIQAAEPVGKAPFDLTYLDRDTELVIFSRPAAVLESPFVEALAGGRLGWIDEMPDQIGIGLDEIDTVTIGIRNLQQIAQQGEQQFSLMQGSAFFNPGSGAPPAVDASADTIVVVRTTAPVSLDDIKLAQAEGDARTELTHRSKTYYRVSEAAGGSGCLYSADPTTWVLADEAAIKQIIEQGSRPALARLNLGFIPAAADVIVAAVPKDRDALLQRTQELRPSSPQNPADALSLDPMASMMLLGNGDLEDQADDSSRFRQRGVSATGRSAAGASIGDSWESQVKGGALLVNFGADLTLDVLVHCDSAEAAEDLHGDAEEAVSSLTQAFEDAGAMLPGVIQQIGGAVLDSVASRAEGSVVTISATLPESQQSNLSVVPMALMGMMMTGSFAAKDIGPLVDWQDRAGEVLARGQPPASAEGLPAGIELRALARWGVPPVDAPHAAPPLEVAIVASGPRATQAVAFGQLELTQLDAGAGARLKWLGAAHTTGTENPAREFVRIDREAMFPLHPREGVATGFIFGLPGDAPDKLSVLAGAFTLKVTDHVRQVTIDDVASAMRSIEDEALRDAEFNVTSSADDVVPALVFTYKNSQAIGAVSVLDANGLPLGGTGESTAAVGGYVRQTITLPAEADPESLGFRVSVFEDLEELPLAFRFEDLSLPEPLTLTAEQRALLTWTPSDLVSELPEGLMVEMQARWPSPQTSTDGVPFASSGRSRPSGAIPPGVGNAGLPDGFFPGLGNGAAIPGGRSNRRGRDDDDERSRGSRGRRGDDEEDEPPRPFSGRGQAQGAAAGTGIEFALDAALLGAGLSASASTRSSTGTDGLLQLVVDLTGPLAESVTALKEPAVETAVSELGSDLTFEAGLHNWQEISDDWVDIDPEIVPTDDQPPDGLRVTFLFTSPDPPIEQIKQFKGTLQLRAAREQIEAVVKNLNNRTNRRIKDRTLGKFGIDIAVNIEENQLMFRQLEGDETRIADMFPVDQNGVRIEDVTQTTALENGNVIHYFNFGRNVPPRVGLKFLVNLGVQELEVPLRFRNVPVPPPPG